MTRATKYLWGVAIVLALLGFTYPGFAFFSDGDRKPAVAAPGTTTTTMPVTTMSTTTTVPETTTTTTVAVEEPAPPADPCAAEIAPEATVKVDKGCTVSGDVRASRSEARAPTTAAIAYYDGKGTKSVTSMSEEGFVFARWGASVSNKSVDELCGEGACLRNNWPELPDYPDPEVGDGVSQKARAAAQAEAAARPAPIRTQPTTPARAPTASPPPATEPSAPAPPADECHAAYKDALSVKGGEAHVAAGCRVIGDVFIDGVQFHDDNDQTCQVTVMDRSGRVKAPYSAGVSSRPPEELLAENCGGRTGEIKRWPGDLGTFPTGTPADECHAAFKDALGVVGGEANVPAGCRIIGDVFIDGVKFHDDNDQTCQVTVMDRSGHVKAPYSAGVSSRSPEALLAENCGGRTGEIKRWPGDLGTFPT